MHLKGMRSDMEQFIGCDAHKHYSVFVGMNERGEYSRAVRVSHEEEEVGRLLDGLPAGSRIAVEASGYCYWLIDEMQSRGHKPVLTHPVEAKRRMGRTKKTDRVDAQALAMLLRNGTLPEVWIPPAALRDQREPMRLRMALSRTRTRLKNRIHGVLGRFNIRIAVSDLFGVEGRAQLELQKQRLPEYTRASVEQALRVLDCVEQEIEVAEGSIRQMLQQDEATRLLDSLPGVGPVLSAVLALEIGDVRRFATGAQLASYAGLTPSVYSSGGHTRLGPVGQAVNRTLKWAFVEAAQRTQACRSPQSHVARLYRRVRDKKNHQKATVAVARHLAEAAFGVLRRKQFYREPASAPARSTGSKHTASLTHE